MILVTGSVDLGAGDFGDLPGDFTDRVEAR